MTNYNEIYREAFVNYTYGPSGRGAAWRYTRIFKKRR